LCNISIENTPYEQRFIIYDGQVFDLMDKTGIYEKQIGYFFDNIDNPAMMNCLEEAAGVFRVVLDGAGSGRRGPARRGRARLGLVWRGLAGQGCLWHINEQAWSGRARRGAARQGTARRGKGANGADNIHDTTRTEVAL
jgi:hypothetical protein